MSAIPLICYGSETGTAIEVSERISRCLKRRYLDAKVISCNQFPFIALPSFAVFVVATTGDGEEPLNMKEFWNYLLKKSHPSDMLSHMQFAVFGLGDSSYQKFNFVGKKLFKRLLQLGAKPVIDRGDGDDQHYLGFEHALSEWLPQLLDKINKDLFPLDPEKEIISENVLLPPSLEFEVVSDQSERVEIATNAIVLSNVRQTVDTHFQDIRLIRFETDLSYGPGDIVSVFPKNDPKKVTMLLDLLEWSSTADLPLKISKFQKSVLFNEFEVNRITTLREILTKYVEPFTTPRDKYFFELLSHFSCDQLHKDRLLEIAKDQQEFIDYCYRPKRTAFEVLADFKSSFARPIPFEYVFDLFTPVRPREFSICSRYNGKELELLVGVVKYKTMMKEGREGVCTNWMSRFIAGEELRINVKQGTFHLPGDHTVPAVFIGPGLGIAPIRALIHERITQESHENYLFFGCRYKDKDFLFEDEWNRLVSAKSLVLFTAFSRERVGTKIYVQHRIYQQKQLLWQLLERNCFIYVCGNSKSMPDDVRNAWKQVMIECGNLSSDEAEEYLKYLRKSGRYQVEAWS